MNDRVTETSERRGWRGRLAQLFSHEPRDRRQLIEILRDAQRRDVLDADALEMIEGVIEIAELQVRDVMVPRAQMKVVKGGATLHEMLPVIVDSGHSRFPVIGDSRDEVLGVLLAKDLLRYFAEENTEAFDLQDILRLPVFIPESKRLNVLLKEFRRGRNHMAIVVDEYGGVAGLITIEDVLEEIVGEISDEYDVEDDSFVTRLGPNQYAVVALMPIDEFNEQFGTHYSDEAFDTIGGLVLSRFGRLPRRGETVTLDQFRFKVTGVTHRRIESLLMEVLPAKGQT